MSNHPAHVLNHVNDREPNWYEDLGRQTHENPTGFRFMLSRCFACEPDGGWPNSALHIGAGECVRCGWTEPRDSKRQNERPVADRLKIHFDPTVNLRGTLRGYRRRSTLNNARRWLFGQAVAMLKKWRNSRWLG